MLDQDPILPAWLVLPLGAIALLVLAGHLLALNADSNMDPQRRRIRMTNAVLMMLTVPLVAYGFGVATPAHSRTFIYVWVLAAAILFLIIMVAAIDILNTWKVQRVQMRELRRKMAAARGAEARAALLGLTTGHKPGRGDEPGAR
jgi:hypothetical protein